MLALLRKFFIIAARACAPRKHAPPPPAPEPPEPVRAWVASLAPGTEGRAVDLLPAFLASSGEDPGRWPTRAFGRALASLRGRVVAGRKVVMWPTRNGAFLYKVVDASPVAAVAEP